MQHSAKFSASLNQGRFQPPRKKPTFVKQKTSVMKTRHVIIPLALALAATARAQSPEPTAGVSTPVATASAPAPGKTIYLPRLPSASELTTAAAAQHLAITRIEQTATQVTVTYQGDGGAATTVAYRLLSSATTEAPAAVVYRPAPTVIYYDDYGPGYYRPDYWYPPVSLRLGVGFGFHGGHFGRGH